MVRQKLDKEIKKAILKARNLIEEVARADGNEAETRTRIHDFFEMLMGYDRYDHITQEYAIHGAGNTVHCDLAVQIQREESSTPDFLVEIKKVNIDLSPKHLGQAASYAIDKGCEWVLLTNGRDWKLYHVSFGKPPQTKLVDSWNLLTGDPVILAEKFSIVGYKNIKKGGLALLWEKNNVLTAHNLLKIILSEQSLTSLRIKLKKETGITVTPEEIIGAVRRLLNEASLAELEKLNISASEKRQKKPTAHKRTKKEEDIKQEATNGQ